MRESCGLMPARNKSYILWKSQVGSSLCLLWIFYNMRSSLVRKVTSSTLFFLVILACALQQLITLVWPVRLYIRLRKFLPHVTVYPDWGRRNCSGHSTFGQSIKSPLLQCKCFGAQFGRPTTNIWLYTCRRKYTRKNLEPKAPGVSASYCITFFHLLSDRSNLCVPFRVYHSSACDQEQSVYSSLYYSYFTSVGGLLEPQEYFRSFTCGLEMVERN